MKQRKYVMMPVPWETYQKIEAKASKERRSTGREIKWTDIVRKLIEKIN